jgi:hypothetical protein
MQTSLFQSVSLQHLTALHHLFQRLSIFQGNEARAKRVSPLSTHLKAKGKFVPLYSMNAYGGTGGATPVFNIDSRWRWVGKLRVQATQPPGKNAGSQWIASRMDPGASFYILEKKRIFYRCWVWTPDRRAHSLVTIQNRVSQLRVGFYSR